MASKEYNFTVEQGQDHTKTIVIDALVFPLTGYTIGEMHIRKTCESATTELELTVVNGKITIDDITNKVIFVINDTDSFLISNNSVYDLFIENPTSGDRKKLLAGKITVKCAVTRT